MSEGWTPGPWFVTTNHNHRVRIVAGPHKMWGVATVHALVDQSANAHLIAAAPALYEALADLVENKCSPHCDWEAAEAALSLARGASS